MLPHASPTDQGLLEGSCQREKVGEHSETLRRSIAGVTRDIRRMKERASLKK